MEAKWSRAFGKIGHDCKISFKANGMNVALFLRLNDALFAPSYANHDVS